MEAQDLDNEIVSLRRRVREIREEMLAVWKDGNDGQDYELRAVFFHRGKLLAPSSYPPVLALKADRFRHRYCFFGSLLHLSTR